MQPPLTFSERHQLVIDFTQQAREKESLKQRRGLFPDHPKAIVRYLLTGYFVNDEADMVINDEQFVLDYIEYERALEHDQQLRNALGIRLTLDPEITACTLLSSYRRSPQHLNILSTMRDYLKALYRSYVPTKHTQPFKYMSGF